jgi:tetratricopeptide (TPR) repeat protein/predicted Ser/Thr protein kinase
VSDTKADLSLDLKAQARGASGAATPLDDGEATYGDDDLSVEGRRVLAAVKAELFHTDEPPPRIGRFVVLRKLGEGGMGEVYLAYDAELDRRLAIKLVRADVASGRADTFAERLRKEAQAIARLSDPHVVPVFEVGRDGDRTFVAMEYVAGSTLRAWLKAEPRSLDAILQVFAQAGAGLCAAHRAGVVHRDFKPDNVLVGEDGRVRVVDFGLARSAAPDPSGSTDDPAVPGRATTPGLGTPRYMAPEQWAGDAIDARADQFAFCVSLWEALHGVPPFPGRTPAEVCGRVLAGNIEPPPAGRRVPRAIRDALRRGLSNAPADRFADLSALLQELARVRGRSRRRAGWGVLLVACTGVLLVALRDTEPRCEPGGARLGAVWGDTGRDGVVLRLQALVRSPHAIDVAVAAVDERAAAWMRTYDESCAATRIRGERSPEAFERRVACLDTERARLLAFAQALGDEDDAAAAKAIEAASDLPDPSRCLQAADREEAPPPPCATDVRAEIARTQVERTTARPADARTRADAALQAAESCGDATARAEALLERGRIALMLEEPDADATLIAAAKLAIESRNEDALVGAAITLADRYGVERDEPAHGRSWLSIAEAAAAELATDDPRQVDLLEVRADLAEADGRIDESEAHLRDALTRLEAMGRGDRPVAARLYTALAWVAQRRAQWEPALELHERALAIRREVLSEDHPSLASTWNGIGTVYGELGRLDEAEAAFAEGLRVLERSVGRSHPDAATLYLAMASRRAQNGRLEAAWEALEHAREVIEESPTAITPKQRDYYMVTRAILLAERGELAESEAEWRQVAERRMALWGGSSVNTALAHVSLCQVLGLRERWDEAAAECRRAIAIHELATGRDDPSIAELWERLAKAERAAGREQAAEIAEARARHLGPR